MRNRASILIPTRNRPQILAKCLDSLRKQTVSINQVVVVDNGLEKSAKKVIAGFRKDFKIDYFKEKKQGEAFARNRALKLAKNDIVAFIDDDCVADKDWLKNIYFHFREYPDSDGLVGKTENYLRDNLYANIYQCYYLRWLIENFNDFEKTQLLTRQNSYFDTKNLAFKRSFVKDFSFDPDILFHSINVDNVAGEELSKKGKFLYYPAAIVYHQNPSSFKELMRKNFIQGVADQLILERKKIDTRKKPLKYSYLGWLRLCRQEIKNLSFLKEIIFWLMIFIFPISYKAGRIYYKVKYVSQ